MKNEKGITLLALIIIVVVLVIIAAISVMVFRKGSDEGTTEEEIADINEQLVSSDYDYLPDESETADPEIDVDKELEDSDDTELTEDEKAGSNANVIDPDANILDENIN